MLNQVSDKNADDLGSLNSINIYERKSICLGDMRGGENRNKR